MFERVFEMLVQRGFSSDTRYSSAKSLRLVGRVEGAFRVWSYWWSVENDVPYFHVRRRARLLAWELRTETTYVDFGMSPAGATLLCQRQLLWNSR